MDKPDYKKQLKESESQYKDCLITKEEYYKQIKSINEKYEQWCLRNDNGDSLTG